ncbi:hypothetical protein HWD31_gp57 [Pantoea phage vB_PagM_SSEM1]|uniref:Uncharacterized protein n=1 Tax=Pantoea phage vB_PagM_SSEM1 TaxID=2721760 RepID=A0A6H0DBQ2_9CAUD|nr:hypothetical protein HWD31_gp57 [Pantoea phage vB_PagM_SSEM1]QIS79355.1 hypothetical protein SSEM1_gp57 [Pantoea phage vB_PagM_SSEM1]
MAQLVYALYDVQEMKLSQFTADASILVKDAVSAYLAEKVLTAPYFSSEVAKDILTALSKSNDIPELLVVLEAYDFKLVFTPIIS